MPSAITALIALLAGLFLAPQALSVPPSPGDSWVVSKVIDGDTLKASSSRGEITVRLIGVDTPETKHPTKPVGCYGKEASDFAREYLLGRTVVLGSDPTQGSVDKYGRTLAYVYVDGELFNQVLLARGLAREYTYGKPYLLQPQFRASQQDARAQGAGLWANCPRAGG